MEKVVIKSYDKELMRMAMIKHEQTFKEQVYELHRLYRIQKMLMNTAVGVNNQDDQRDLVDHNQALRNTDDRVGVEAADHAERIAESNDSQSMRMLDESEIELTLSLGPRRPRTDKSESGQSVSSSSTGSSQTRKTSPKNSSSFKWGSESEPGFSKGQQNNPPWMFQALSFKLS